jgi:small nuclear ribonucleoprotein (snRNP)-like protein
VDRGTAREFDRYANTVLLTSAEHQSKLEAFKNRKPKARDQAE